MGAVDNVGIVREMYRLFAQRDNEEISRLFDPEIEWTQMQGFPRGGRHVSADAIFNGVFAGFREQWELWRTVAERCVGAGASVVALGFYEGTYRRTGRSMRAEFVHLFDLEAGRIIRFVQYAGTLKVAEVMGLV